MALPVPFDPQGFPIVNAIIGGMAPGPIPPVITADLTANINTQPAPDPSEVTGANGDVYADPDHVLRTRARVSTDEQAFLDDFNRPGATMQRPLTGTSLFTAASTAVVGTGTLYLAEVRTGDYVELNADDAPAAPVWAQVASITDNTHLTLVAAYAGLGALIAGAASVSPWSIYYTGAGAGIAVAASVATLTPGAANGADILLVRALSTVGAFRRGGVVSLKWLAAIDQRRANQNTYLSIMDASGLNRVQVGFGGAVNTVASMITGCDGGASLETTNATLPSAGVTTAYHLYELRLSRREASFYIDDVLVARHTAHVPDPYGWAFTATAATWLTVQIHNSAAMGGATNLTVDAVRVEQLDDVVVRAENPRAEADLDGMAICLPGSGGEAGLVAIAKDAAAHTLVTATTNFAYFWVQVLPTAAGDPTRVRIKAPGPAVATDMWLYSTQTPVAIGPLAAGQTISCWVDAAEPAAVDVQYSRISK
jgi:hypothetical protein